MAQPAQRRLTFAQYLAFDRAADVRHEFVDGIAIAMAGGSRAHAQVSGSVIRSLGNAAVGTACRVYSSDLRIRIPETGRAYYPDATVICGPSESDPEDTETVINPIVVVEVLSKSTEADDRGSKWQDYKRLVSLRHYLLVSQWSRRIEHFERQPDGGWTYHDYGPVSEIVLSPPGLTLDMADLYQDVELSASPLRDRHAT